MIKKDDWNLILVNYQNPIPNGFFVNLGKVYNEYENNYYLVDKKIVKDLNNMLNVSKKENINLAIFSGYRNIQKQIQLVANSIKKNINENKAYYTCFSTLAIPGFSEHHTGLAIDIYSDNDLSYDNLDFENTKAFSWLIDNSYKYGFILRYPKDKENITKIKFEPWHFRYVGTQASKIIYENKICLEEFIESL